MMKGVRLIVYAFAFFIFGNIASNAQSGIYESYAILDTGSGNTYYDLQATTANIDFDGANLGTFTPTSTFILNGAQNKVYKCGVHNIFNGWFNYRVYLASATPPVFTSSAILFGANDPTSNFCGGTSTDQTWESSGAGINIINGLPSGDYIIEMYTHADYDSDITVGTNSDLDGTHFANNDPDGAGPIAPNNYKALFRMDNPPTAVCSNFTAQLDATGNVTITAANVDGGSTDDFGIASLSVSPNTFNCTNLGNNTVTLTVTDTSGQTDTCTATVLVEDSLAPIPDVANLSDVTAECEVTSLTAPTATDNCGGTVTVTNDATLPISTQGTTVVTWTYDDGNGNTSTQTQNVVIDDISDPTIPTLADVTGECSATATAPTTSDNCSGTLTGTTSDALTYNTQGTFVINWTFDDGNGNVIVVPQNVIVDDVTDPTIPTLADVTGECSATATAPTTSDNCSGTLTGTTSDALIYNTQGTFVINWTFDDGNGNVIVVPQNVIVDDVTDPTIPTLADVTGECSATATAPTTSDNCSGTLTGTTSDALTYNTQGTFVINWTFDDGNGNVIVVPQNVIIDDVTDPTIPTLADVTGECSATATAPTTSDNCSGTLTGTTSDALTYNTQGTFVINWTFDDGNGNVIVVPQNVIVDDVTDPTIPTLADVTGECSATATAPTTSDNCSGTLTGTTSDALTYNTQGTFVINWTFDDGNGNVIVVPQNVIVDDVTDPTIPTLADVTGECSATATAPTTSDNCSGTLTGTTSDALTYNTQGTFVINWTFDDGNGNVIVVPQNVIVDDVTDPTIPTLADVTGECSATATAPTTSDNCSGTLTGTTSDALTYNTQGTFVINWTFDDGNGNVIVVPQNVIVDDVTDPTIPTLADVTGECSATATAPTTSDNCSGTLTGTTSDALTYNTQGTFVINWTFDDSNGNVIVVPQNVIVDDVTDPTIPTLADVTGECSATATAPTTSDNCSGTLTGTTSDALTYNTQGTFVINWTFDDGNGNVIVVPQNVIVDDVTDPTIPTLADVTGECSATATAPTTSDNCSGTLTGTTSDALTYNTQGTFVINWTFDDGNGNVIVVPQNVIVDDVTDPTIPTLADVTGECSATATAPTTSDNCSGTLTGTTSDALTYNTQGTFVINWTFDDGNGNVIVVPQNVIVDDVTDPTIPTLADVTGECSATATAPTTSDNCSGTLTGTTSDALTYNTQGTFVINWTFDDSNGNVIVVPQNVIVDDVTDPTIPTLADVTGECSATATAPTTSDNCSGTLTGTTSDALTYNTQGTFVINWTFDDGNGNVIVVPQNVIVDDVTDPTIPTLADVTGECSATATAPTTSDNCSGTLTGTTSDALTYNTQGTFVINWTFDDGNGNVIVVPQNVIIDDVTDPTIPTLADVTGECSATATAPTTSDNCSGTLTGTTSDALTYNTQGTFVINWTFDDGNGNVIVVPQNVIVDDVTDPTIPTLADVTGECSATATAPTTSDNCSGTLTGTTSD
ncbi:beta strand repeat-containing protein, partial [Psychroserpens luteolus]|uniref:beta strand repeat-containing protein n=1 Tax=Psychroserpens luteolus TaxID=2855840 RepID=UPI001E5344A5